MSTSASRSRATSNTSAGSFGTSLPHLPSPLHTPAAMPSSPPLPQHRHTRSISKSSPPMPADPAQVTETVARMLQCLSVVAGVQTSDHSQTTLEKLTGALKYNWLGRGRTGRQRRGWVGKKAGASAGTAIGGNAGGAQGSGSTVAMVGA